MRVSCVLLFALCATASAAAAQPAPPAGSVYLDGREARGVATLYRVGHSMGARMATPHLAEVGSADIAGFIGVGVRNSGANLAQISLPVRDLYGSGVDRAHAPPRAQHLRAAHDTQVEIAEARE